MSAVTAADVDAVVAAVPGVARVFAVDPAALRAARRLAGGAADVPLSSVSWGADGVRIVVSVAVEAEDPAAIARAVAAAVRLRAGSDADTMVRISRVVPSEG